MRVPGTIGAGPEWAGMNFHVHWMVEVREKYGAKHPYGYFVSGSLQDLRTKEQVADYLKNYYPHVETLSCRRVTELPGAKLIPVPPTHFQWGLSPQYKTPWDQFSDPKLIPPNHSRILVPVPKPVAKIQPIRVAKIEPLAVQHLALQPLLG